MARIHLITRQKPSVDVIKVGAIYEFAWTGLDHGRHHACGWEGGSNLTAATSTMVGLGPTGTYQLKFIELLKFRIC